MKKLLVTTAIAAVCFGASLRAAAADTTPTGARVTITVDRTHSGTPAISQSYVMVVPHQGNGRIMLGDRVPMPVMEAAGSEGDNSGAGMVRKYSYQEVGFVARVDSAPVDDGRLRLSGTIDISSVRRLSEPKSGSTPPVVESVEQRFDVVAADGVPAILLEVDDEKGNQLRITLEAAYLH